MRLKLIIVLTFFCNAHSFAVLDFVFPFDNYITKEATVPVSWNKISSFSQYELQQSTDNTFTSNVTKYNVVGNSYTLNALQFDVNYDIRVRGVQAGVKTEWSPIVSFQRFSPAAIGGQQLWLSADESVTQSGGDISAWNDLSIQANNAIQATPSLMPKLTSTVPLLNNKPSVKLDGVDDFLQYNEIANTRAFFAIFTHTTGSQDYTSPFGGELDFTSNTSTSFFLDPSSNAKVYNGEIYANKIYQIPSNRSLMTKPTKFTLYRFITTGNVKVNHVASDRKVSGRYWNGSFAEIILYSDTLLQTERNQIEDYLLSKYAPKVSMKDTIIGVSFCSPILLVAPNNYMSYTWSTGATTPTININTNSSYSLKTKDVFNIESTTTLNVYPYQRLGNKSIYLCQGDTFKVDLQTPIGFTALWNTGANTTQINITQGGQYTVKVTDANNCFVYDTINVIIDNPALSPTPNIANNLTLCEGEKLFLTTPTAFDSIHWSTGANTNFITVTSPGAYSVYGITSSGCVINKNFNVTIAGKAPTAQFAVAPACQNAALAFTDSSKVPAGNTIQSWNWTFSNNSTSSVQNPSTTFSNLGTQTASLKIKTNVGCTDSIAKTFVVNRNPTPSFYNLLSCEGMPTIFADQTIANAAAVTDWSWNFGGLGISNGKQNPGFSFPAAGNYLVTLKATNSNGCSDTISRQVAVNSSPNANFSFDSVCGKTPVNLKFLATVQAPSVIPDINWGSWDFGDGTIETAIRNPQHIYNEPGTYDVKLVVKSSNQCLDTVVKQIKVFDFPVVDFTISPTQCVGKSIQFTDISATPDGTPISKWNWYFSGLATDTIQHPKYTFNSQGNYTIQLTAQNTVGCSNTKLRSIAVSSPPIPKFTFSPQNGLPPLNVNYVNQSATNGNYLWNYGDGGPFIAGYNPPPHVYTAIGTYPIKLVATDFRGCTDTLTKFILVDRAYLDGVMASISLIPTSGDFYKVQVSIINNSNVEITALGLSLQLGGGAEIRENWTGSLLPGQTTVYLFNGELRAGDNSIPVVCASIDNVNNNATENRTDNNTTCKEIKVGGFDILTIFPNPAYDNNINFGVMLPAAGKVNIRFVDVLGQQMYQSDFDGIKGYNQFAMPIGMLNATVYVAEVSFDGEVVRKKFMRKNR